MIAQIITENGQKKLKPLTADAGAGNPVGTIIPMYKKSSPSGYLYCDGSTFDQTKYPLLYAYLGSNVLPDYREFALVGAEENTTDVYNASTNPTGTIHDHDVYTEGQAKDDNMQEHSHYHGNQGKVPNTSDGIADFKFAGGATYVFGESTRTGVVAFARTDTVTRGKRKAVYFYIKATSGLTEGQQDDVANIINGERSYSTSEVNTGKKWIDGKPIYRRVFEYNNVSCNTGIGTGLDSNFPIALTNIVNLYGVGYKINSTLFIVPNYFRSSDQLGVLQNISSDTYNFKVVCEYTKTT